MEYSPAVINLESWLKYVQTYMPSRHICITVLSSMQNFTGQRYCVNAML